MRPSILVRGGTLLIAAALALSLGTAPATASETTAVDPVAPAATPEQRSTPRLATGADIRRTAARATTRVAAAAAVDVTRIRALDGVLADPDFNYVDFTTFDMFLGDAEYDALQEVEVDLRIDDKARGTYPVYYYEDEDILAIEFPGWVGAGKARITGTTLRFDPESGIDDTYDPTDSNSFHVRRLVDFYEAWWEKSGKTKKFVMRGLQIFVPSTGAYKSLGKVKLQYKKGSKWKTKKTIKLDRDGDGSYRFKTSKKYRYRFYSAETTTSTGFRTEATPKL